jgi:microsomal dipeptidase-like Zn-dependent dipeptidase
LQQGNVKLQTLPVFTETAARSTEKGQQQLHIYKNLPVHYPQDIQHFSSQANLESQQVHVLLAFENASGFCDEKEPLEHGLKRFKKIILEVGKPLYVGLTWNSENRFGGGALTPIGLKEDGKRLLEELYRQQIAVDLSHASDALAYEVLDYIEGQGWDMPVIASHSNARAVCAMPRNLPDEIAREIFRRNGVVGLNLYRPFVGEREDQLVKHVAHWLELGGESSVVFGADFFYDPDLPSTLQYGKEVYLKDYQEASCYGRLLTFLQGELKLKAPFWEKFAYQNALSFINRTI